MTRMSGLLLWIGLFAAPSFAAAQENGYRFVAPSFVAVQVRDLPASVDWYVRALDLTLVNSIDDPDGRYEIRLLSNDLLRVELIWTRTPADERVGPMGLFKTGFFVDDAGAAHAALGALGYDVDSRTFVDDVLSVRTFLMRDPEGNRLQFMEECGTGCGG